MPLNHLIISMKKIHPFAIYFIFVSCMNTARDSLYLKKLVYKGNTLLYRVLIPENYNHDKTYPLDVFLYGSGECGNDNSKQLSHVSNPQHKKKYSAIVIFPQCPLDDVWINKRVTIMERLSLLIK